MGTYSSKIWVWDIETNTCVGTLDEQDVTSVSLLSDSQMVTAAAKHCGSVRLWDTSAYTCVGVLAKHNYGLHEVLAPTDNRIVAGTYLRDEDDWPVRRRPWEENPPCVNARMFTKPCCDFPDRSVSIVTATGPIIQLPDGRIASALESTVRLWHIDS